MTKTTLCWILLLLATMGIQGSDKLTSYPCPKECDCYVRNTGELIVDVFCHLTLPLDPKNNFSIIKTDIKSILYLSCDSLFDASLADDMFSNLKTFVGINFRDCRFRNIPHRVFSGMTSLEIMVINNAFSPQIHPNAFDYIPNLTQLSIVNSGIISVPKLCSMKKLKFLNLTNNIIQDIHDSGIFCENKTGLQNLTFFSLNKNRLTGVDVDIGKYVPNLFRYEVSENRITSLTKRALQNMPELEYFDATANEISSIDDEVFRYNTKLKILGIGLNPLKTLPVGIFHSVTDLQLLSLNSAKLNDSVWMELLYFSKAVEIQLDNNNFTTLNKLVISKWSKIAYLDFSNNQIRKLKENMFYNQYNLQTLLLLGNRINRIERLSFNGLLNVTRLELQYNHIIDIHNDSFHFLPSLTGLNISYNQLTEMPTLRDLTQLIWLDLRSNFIRQIPPNTFEGLHKLAGLNMMWNDLRNISRFVLKPLRSLTTLNLAHNKIEVIEENALSGLYELAWLRLQYNKMTDISRLFIDVSKTLISLDLSHNKIRGSIHPNTFPNTLQYLDLSNNEITGVAMYTFYKFESLRSVNLKNNLITTLSQPSLYVSRNNVPTPFVYISGNRFNCDCKLKWLREKMDESRPSRDSAIIPDLDVILCVDGFRTKNTFLYKVDPNNLLCEYTDECPPPCQCCEFHCHCRYMCPDMCSCYRTMSFSPPSYVICTKTNITNIPFNLPSIASHVYLDGNNFTVLTKHIFLHLSRRTKYLYLNKSHIETIENRTFIGLKALHSLFLNNNGLTDLTHGMFVGLDNLIELNLERNFITDIDSIIFTEMPKLERLYLRDNLLVIVPDSFFYFASFLYDMTLSGNRWSCNCSFLSTLFQETFEIAGNVSDIKDLQCARQTPNYTVFYNLRDLNIQKHCPNISSVYFNHTVERNITFQSVQKMKSKDNSIIYICAIISVCVIFFIFSVAFWKRDLIQLVLFTKFGCRLMEEDDDFNKIYDAFISYSSFDENFVVHQLVPKLESPGHGFKLCVHYRDFPVGAPIADTIISSIESSRRTIIVLSNNFLKSEWCEYEFQAAHHHAIRNKNCKLIVILRHEIDKTNLDPQLRYYLKTRTYLKYGDPWFWDKLLYAMPDIRSNTEDHLLEQQQQHHHYDVTPDSLRSSTPELVNTVCGSLPDDEGYETPMSRPTSELNTMTKDSMSDGKLSSHSSNIYEEIA